MLWQRKTASIQRPQSHKADEFCIFLPLLCWMWFASNGIGHRRLNDLVYGIGDSVCLVFPFVAWQMTFYDLLRVLDGLRPAMDAPESQSRNRTKE